jgi:hypothetical protein
MSLSQCSKKIINFFKNHNCLYEFPYLTQESNSFLLLLFDHFKKSKEYIKTLHIERIVTKEIPMPKTFPSDSIVEDVKKEIHKQIKYVYVYNTIFFNRKVSLYFCSPVKRNYQKEVEFILMWLYVLNIYSSKQCAEEFTVYIYLTNLQKKIPNSKSITLDKCHVNTAFTYSCQKNAEIVIYRKEEWMKVFLHETFHTFGLDFSDLKETTINDFIKEHFSIEIDALLFESYTEFWGEVIHMVFLSYYLKPNDKSHFLQTFLYILTIEINHTMLQVNKILHHMDLHYLHFINKQALLKYKENTPVFSYFIIKSILLFHFNDFIHWCIENNKSNIIQFSKKNITLPNYLLFIKKYYKKQQYINELDKYHRLYKKINNAFMKTHLKMCAFEFIF